MNVHVKNVLGVAITLAAIAIGYAVTSYVKTYSQSIEPSAFRSFSVTGEGKVVATPDIAQFSFSVITEGGLVVDELQTKNSEKANAAIAYLKSLGIDARDITTQQYSVEPRYQYYQRELVIYEGPVPPPEIVGYTVRQSVSVKIRDFDAISSALSGVVERGANSVSQLSFAVDDPVELQNQAREKAIGQAEEKARRTAVAAGFSVGRLLSIDEYGGPIIPYYAKGVEALGGDGASGVAPVVEPGSQEITANVTLRYEIR